MHASRWRFAAAAAACLSLSLPACDLGGTSASKDESGSKRKKKRKKKKKKRDDDDGDGSVDAAPAPAPAAPDAAVTAFFRGQIAACNAHQIRVGNAAAGESFFDGSAQDPSRSLTVIKNLGAQRFLVQDAGGTRLIVDLARQQITGPTGPTGEVPRPYTFCPHQVWVGTMDEGHVEPPPAPVPVPVAPPPGALGADGLPLVIPPPTSAVPSLDEWNAVPREITVRRSSSLGCETKMLREWLRVSCRGRGSLGVPIAVYIHKQQGQQAYKFATAGTVTSLVAQVVRGRSLEAEFVWENGGSHRGATLVVRWPRGAPKPVIAFQ